MKVLGTVLNFNSVKGTNLADPTANTDAANKQYVDSLFRGNSWKDEVMAASTANVTLASPGTTLDGVTLAVNDRVLLKDQTAPAENGIYVWTASGSALTRSVDTDSGTEISGMTVTVQRGTVNADRVYHTTADDPITLGTTAIPFVQIGGASTTYTGSNGILLTGSNFTAVVDPVAGGGLAVTASGLKLDVAVAVRKFAASIGNGALTTIVTAHGLGTADLTVAVRDTASGELVYPDVTVDATNVTCVFATAPASNAYRLIVHG